jgi:hypothetical protein
LDGLFDGASIKAQRLIKVTRSVLCPKAFEADALLVKVSPSLPWKSALAQGIVE